MSRSSSPRSSGTWIVAGSCRPMSKLPPSRGPTASVTVILPSSGRNGPIVAVYTNERPTGQAAEQVQYRHHRTYTGDVKASPRLLVAFLCLLVLAACSMPSAKLEVDSGDLTLHPGRQSLTFVVHNTGPRLSLLSWELEASDLIIASSTKGVVTGGSSAYVEITADLSLYESEPLHVAFNAGDQRASFELAVEGYDPADRFPAKWSSATGTEPRSRATGPAGVRPPGWSGNGLPTLLPARVSCAAGRTWSMRIRITTCTRWALPQPDTGPIPAFASSGRPLRSGYLTPGSWRANTRS